MTALREMRCTPVRKEDRPLSDAEIREYAQEIPGWKIIDREGILRLERDFRFKNFSAALDFTVRVGENAEAEDHHPALLTEWGRVTVTWWTHRVRGLHRNDFIMAAKTDEIYAWADSSAE
jgi:4a-hydroxytetrahydrobiopterin dehydratase